MPTNLPPEYFDAERRYKQAATSQENIAALEELISTVLKHKGTDRLRADLLVVAAEIPQDFLNIDREIHYLLVDRKVLISRPLAPKNASAGNHPAPPKITKSL